MIKSQPMVLFARSKSEMKPKACEDHTGAFHDTTSGEGQSGVCGASSEATSAVSFSTSTTVASVVRRPAGTPLTVDASCEAGDN